MVPSSPKGRRPVEGTERGADPSAKDAPAGTRRARRGYLERSGQDNGVSTLRAIKRARDSQIIFRTEIDTDIKKEYGGFPFYRREHTACYCGSRRTALF